MPRGSGFKKTGNPPKRKSSDQAKTNTGLRAFKAEARRRDGDCCVKCGVILNGSGNVHHRRNRGQGGSRKANVISNMITLCGTPLSLCHGEVTLEPDKCDAFGNGWRLSTNGTTDPATEPVNVAWLGWALPLADGTWQAIDAREVA
ncbi:hypothetical protein ACBJ32_17170 [Nonomuraea sp. GTA35]